MRFRTTFVFAVALLAFIAFGAASLLIVSARQNKQQHTQIVLAYESLSGYLQLSGLVFRTFKQTRRDLLSGDGTFEFDLDGSQREISQTLDALEDLAQQEVQFYAGPDETKDLRELLRETLDIAFKDIRTASNLIQTGSLVDGRTQAIDVLEQQVDVVLSGLIEASANHERGALDLAQLEIERANEMARFVAIVVVVLALAVSAFVLIVLSRRFAFGLKRLDQGAAAFSAGNLKHEIVLSGNDEFSVLAHNFNAMATQILARRNDLEKIKLDLEQRVQERTNELSDVNKQLQERDDLRTQFFADIGHELRTPVTAIRGEAEVALRANAGNESDLRAALKRIISVSEQLTSYVSDLFLIAREQAGVFAYNQERVDLNSVAQVSLDELRGLIKSRGSQLNMHTSSKALWINGDEARLSQLVRVLITNALEHTHKGVQITVSTDSDDALVYLSVSDDGPGVLPKDQGRIFDRFFKGGSSNPNGTNTGLGLAIAKSIVQAHGGAIHAEQAQKGGALFLASFPHEKVGN